MLKYSKDTAVSFGHFSIFNYATHPTSLRDPFPPLRGTKQSRRYQMEIAALRSQ